MSLGSPPCPGNSRQRSGSDQTCKSTDITKSHIPKCTCKILQLETSWNLQVWSFVGPVGCASIDSLCRKVSLSVIGFVRGYDIDFNTTWVEGTAQSTWGEGDMSISCQLLLLFLFDIVKIDIFDDIFHFPKRPRCKVSIVSFCFVLQVASLHQEAAEVPKMRSLLDAAEKRLPLCRKDRLKQKLTNWQSGIVTWWQEIAVSWVSVLPHCLEASWQPSRSGVG